MRAFKLSFRKVVIEDADLIYAWRNHKKIRAQSFNKEFIPDLVHQKWFRHALQNESLIFLMILLDETPLGVIKFRKGMDRQAELDMFLAPEYIGKGLGKKALREAIVWARSNLQDIDCLLAHILPDNLASVKVFKDNGFDLSHSVYKLSLK